MLIYGFGNIGRQDDGLGVLCAEQLGSLNRNDVQVEVNFQLNAEDALLLSKHPSVVFIDASTAIETPYAMQPLKPESNITFSTHAMSPGSILSLCAEIYQHQPEAYVLHIRGYEWDFGLPLSDQAETNLIAATQFLCHWLDGR